MRRVAVVGGGSWGSAFARHCGAIGLPTTLWIREPEVYEEAVRTRQNREFLPGFTFPPAVSFTLDPAEAVRDAPTVFVAVPSEFCAGIYRRIAPHLRPDAAVVSLTKGLEPRTLRRMSEVMADAAVPPRSRRRAAVLSGPSFAREVAAAHPTALVLACRDDECARRIQHLISARTLRVYTSRDVTGVEIAGAVKNVVAIAAGILDGLEFGLNSRAALITRGLVEITKLGVALGARPRTFAGLAGLGDLVLTCTGELSRNHSVGRELGRGRRLDEILAGMRQVAEGVRTTRSVRSLARRLGVEMPITEEVYRVLYRGKPPARTLDDLMLRTLKSE